LSSHNGPPNRARRSFSPALVLILLASAPGIATAASASDPKSSFVTTYCVGCHNDRQKVAGLSLEKLTRSEIGDHADVWETVLEKLQAREMPPAGLPRPPQTVQKQFTDWLESELDHAAAANPDPGHPTIHRLNRNEYSNAVRDLLGLDVKAGDSLPLDDSGYGFDNIGDVLTFSPVLLERYMSVASTISGLAVGSRDARPAINTFTPPREITTKGKPKRNDRISDDLPFGSAGGISVQYAFPADGDYVFKIRLPGSTVGFDDDGAAPVGQVLELRSRISAGMHLVGATFVRSGAVPELFAAPVGQRRGASASSSATQLDVRLDGARLKLYEIPEGEHGPVITDLSIAGPYGTTGLGKTASRERIFVCMPAARNEEEPCARRILTLLARRAFRRPVNEDGLHSLLAVYQAGRAEGNFNSGIELALRAILVSPDFLFRMEHDPAGAAAGSVHTISEVELASRLSFFLWSSIPDDQLLALAEQGKLKDPAILEQQTERMLKDPKSRSFVTNFAGQWLYLRDLDSQRPDPDEFPDFDNALRDAFKKETELFFRSILRENRPVTDLISANYTFLNERLAQFYKIPGVYGPQFRRVELTNPNRFGILGQGSVLTVTSYPNRTSVVQRGKWVLENLLGTPPPPPPPNVPSLDAHGKDGKLSMRQAMEQHRANPACASCHARMDPIGFALENYDGIGAWRDAENGLSIDPSGKLPDGSAFKGQAGLSRLLAGPYRNQFITTFTEKLMTYALGRGIEWYDKPSLRSIVREAAKQNSSIPAIINAIVKSPEFQMRRSGEL
jgi:cytochrome c551/c552